MSNCTVAVDESGRQGANLIAGGAFVLRSTSLSDDEAEQLLAQTLGPPPQAAREWRWRLAATKTQLPQFLDALSASRVGVVAVHHRFFGWCKAVDTLLYEYPVVMGAAPGGDRAQAMTVGIAQFSWEEVRGSVDPFLSAWVEAVRSPSHESLVTLRNAAHNLSRTAEMSEPLRWVMEALTETIEGISPVELKDLTLGIDHVDPHVPAAGALISMWSKRLTDEGRGTWAILHDAIKQGDVVDRWTELFGKIGTVVYRGRSHDHASLQVADLVAGAARAAFSDVPARVGGTHAINLASLIKQWLPQDLTIWPWSDPRSTVRPEGGLNMREDPDR